VPGPAREPGPGLAPVSALALVRALAQALEPVRERVPGLVWVRS
jgi:hypothetical protein